MFIRLYCILNRIEIYLVDNMDLISTQEAADRKGTSPQIIRTAIRRGEIGAVKVGGVNLVKINKKFKQWQRSERHVQAAKTRWAKKK